MLQLFHDMSKSHLYALDAISHLLARLHLCCTALVKQQKLEKEPHALCVIQLYGIAVCMLTRVCAYIKDASIMGPLLSALCPCRETKKSTQQILHQLEQLSLPLLESIDRKLQAAITYDAALSSWQELYRLVSCLDFGTGVATGCATLQSVSILTSCADKAHPAYLRFLARPLYSSPALS